MTNNRITGHDIGDEIPEIQDLPPEAIENESLFRKGQQTQLLCQLIRALSPTEVDAELHEITENQLFHFRISDMGSLAFDIVFSPGVIPKTSQPRYRQAYQKYFQQLYGFDIFDINGNFVFPEISEVMPNLQDQTLHNQFIIEWVANLRAVCLMRKYLADQHDNQSVVNTNLTEAVLCRMAENGEVWPDEVFTNLPIASEIRLNQLREEVDRKRRQGFVLAPGQFFRTANLLEFREQELKQQPLETRLAAIMEMVDQAASSQSPASLSMPPQSVPSRPTFLNYLPAQSVRSYTERQSRGIMLRSLMKTPEHVHNWTMLLLGKSKTLKHQ